MGALNAKQITTRGSAAYVHIAHSGLLEKLLENPIGVAFVNQFVDSPLT